MRLGRPGTQHGLTHAEEAALERHRFGPPQERGDDAQAVLEAIHSLGGREHLEAVHRVFALRPAGPQPKGEASV